MKMLNKLEPYEKGDWVKFYRNGEFVIGEVKYFFRETGGYYYLATDKGLVDIKSVFEKRPEK